MIYTISDGSQIEIDPDDLDLAQSYSWRVYASGQNRIPRVRRHERVNGKQRSVFLHREIAGHDTKYVMFADGNYLNLRRSNLILCETQPTYLQCPFTPDRLHELYWSLQWTETQIREEAARLLGRTVKVNDEALNRWLGECKITKRSSHEAHVIMHWHNPHIRKRAIPAMIQALAEKRAREGWRGEVAHLHTTRMKRIAHKRSTEVIRARMGSREIPCRRTRCASVMIVSVAEYARKPERYCSHRCQMLARHEERQHA